MGEEQYKLNKMTWEDTVAAVRAGKVVLLPVGTMEQHGPHLPVDTDNVLVRHVCEEAARRAPESLACAALVPYGYNAHTMEFPGTVNVRPANFIGYLYDVCASYAHHGFRYIIIVNGHGSNQHLCEAAARQVSMETSARCATTMWDSFLGEVLKQIRESEAPGGIGHACEMETSVYMHLEPEQVRRDKMRKEIAWNVSKYWHRDPFGSGALSYSPYQHEYTQSGVAGDPTVATAEKGRVMAEAAIAGLIEAAKEFKQVVDHPRFSAPPEVLRR
jgi:creatinine amidohydrolase